MKRSYVSFFIVIMSVFALANGVLGQTKKELDKEAIKSMVGCYDVDFKYTETFAPEVDYEFAYDYTSAALEYALLVEETENKIVLQHLLIIPDSNSQMIIKHWRQDWVYEADEEFVYNKDNKWEFFPLSAEQSKGKWTQSVYQVDDSPRYSGTATWTHVDGVSSWFDKADSPLPRREYTKRDDYNVMKRGNRVNIYDWGWVHEQDNDKIIREEGKEDRLLVQEKGYNTYVRKSEEVCESAIEWWAENHNLWNDVRSKWETVYPKKGKLALHKKVDGKSLYEHLFYSKEAISEAELSALIDSYIIK